MIEPLIANTAPLLTSIQQGFPPATHRTIAAQVEGFLPDDLAARMHDWNVTRESRESHFDWRVKTSLDFMKKSLPHHHHHHHQREVHREKPSKNRNPRRKLLPLPFRLCMRRVRHSTAARLNGCASSLNASFRLMTSSSSSFSPAFPGRSCSCRAFRRGVKTVSCPICSAETH